MGIPTFALPKFREPIPAREHKTPQHWIFSANEIKRLNSEERLRGIMFIHTIAMRMNLPTLAICAACLFYQRFLMIRDNDVYELAATCLFIACKAEECIQKVEKLAHICSNLVPEKQWVQKILKLEIKVCETIGFDFQVDDPIYPLLEYTQNLDPVVLQISYPIVFDSFKTTLGLQYQPQIIAGAALLIAMKVLNIKINVKMECLDAALQMIELYSPKKVVKLSLEEWAKKNKFT